MCGNYSRAETIWGNTLILCFSFQIRVYNLNLRKENILQGRPLFFQKVGGGQLLLQPPFSDASVLYTIIFLTVVVFGQNTQFFWLVNYIWMYLALVCWLWFRFLENCGCANPAKTKLKLKFQCSREKYFREKWFKY